MGWYLFFTQEKACVSFCVILECKFCGIAALFSLGCMIAYVWFWSQESVLFHQWSIWHTSVAVWSFCGFRWTHLKNCFSHSLTIDNALVLPILCDAECICFWHEFGDDSTKSKLSFFSFRWWWPNQQLGRYHSTEHPTSLTTRWLVYCVNLRRSHDAALADLDHTLAC
jgi:hypothetical protein